MLAATVLKWPPRSPATTVWSFSTSPSSDYKHIALVSFAFVLMNGLNVLKKTPIFYTSKPLLPFCILLAKLLVSDFQWSFHRHVTFCSMEPDLDQQKVSEILFQDISLIETYSSKSLSSFLGQKKILSTSMSSS